MSAAVAGSGRPRRAMAGRLLARLLRLLRLMMSSEVLQLMFVGPRLRPGCYVYWVVARRSPHWREKRVSVGRRRRMSKERRDVAKTCRCVKHLAQHGGRAIGAGRESPAGGGAKVLKRCVRPRCEISSVRQRSSVGGRQCGVCRTRSSFCNSVCRTLYSLVKWNGRAFGSGGG